MASLTRRPSGAWVIRYMDRRRRKRTLSIGTMPKRSAQTVLRHVEELVGAHLAAGQPDQETSRWLGQISDQLRDKLAEAGLVPGIDAGQPLLSRVCDASIKERRPNCTAGVVARLELTKRMLLDRIGDRPVNDITEADAKAFRSWLLEERSEATVRKRCSDARSFIAWAVDARLIEANPFSAVPATATAQANPEYVSEATVRQVMDELPDARWRLLLALGRWGGLRVPSEVVGLTWADVLWARGRLRIESPKTKGEGKAERHAPLFEELQPLFRDWWEQAPEGVAKVFPQITEKTGGGSIRNVVINACRRAGVTPWPDLWRTLRASRQTDLEARFPLHVVCHWLGNSSQVATRHYLRIHDEHWSAAAGASPEPDPARPEARPGGNPQTPTEAGDPA